MTPLNGCAKSIVTVMPVKSLSHFTSIKSTVIGCSNDDDEKPRAVLLSCRGAANAYDCNYVIWCAKSGSCKFLAYCNITNLHFAIRQAGIRKWIMNKSYSKIRFIYYSLTINANQQSVSLQCFLRVWNLNNLKSEEKNRKEHEYTHWIKFIKYEIVK